MKRILIGLLHTAVDAYELQTEWVTRLLKRTGYMTLVLDYMGGTRHMPAAERAKLIRLIEDSVDALDAEIGSRLHECAETLSLKPLDPGYAPLDIDKIMDLAFDVIAGDMRAHESGRAN